MSRRLQKCLPEIEKILSIKNKNKQKLELRKLSRKECFYLTIKEIARNIIKGNIDMSPSDKKMLRRYKSKIENIACNQNKRKRTQSVIQSGGWLSIALPILIPLITDLISKHGTRS